MKWLAALLGLLASACSPVALLNATVPSSGYVLQADQPYGSHARHKLDVYVPEAALRRPIPVIFFLYGGSWQGGARADYRFVGQALAARGFVVVVPDYRVYPEVRYPEFMRDAAAALAWTHREVARVGGDPSHIVVMGHSAGAHMGAMLAYNDRFLREAGLSRAIVRSFIGLAGPYDFEPDEPAIQAALTGEGEAALAMPTRYVRGGEPPSMLLWGADDKRVGPHNQRRLEAALRAKGSPVDARIVPGLGHPGLVARIATPIQDRALVDAIVEFAAR